MDGRRVPGAEQAVHNRPDGWRADVYGYGRLQRRQAMMMDRRKDGWMSIQGAKHLGCNLPQIQLRTAKLPEPSEVVPRQPPHFIPSQPAAS